MKALRQRSWSDVGCKLRTIAKKLSTVNQYASINFYGLFVFCYSNIPRKLFDKLIDRRLPKHEMLGIAFNPIPDM